jgi:hypothetical protein
MILRRWPRLSDRTSRVLVAVLALLSFLAGTLGFPLPVPAGPRDGRVPLASRGQTCGCCESEQARGSCCCSHRLAQPSCCSGKSSTPTARHKDDGESGTTVVWVVGLKARECRGQDVVWLALQGTAPPPLPLTWSHEDVPAGWLSSFAILPSTVTFSPGVPPPRG